MDPEHAGYRHVACIVDRSPGSARTLREAQRLAAGGGARLSAVHVDNWIPLAMACSAWVPDLAELRECSRLWLWEELRALGAEDAEPVVVDSPAAVCDWARRRDVELIVAQRCRGGLRRLLGFDMSAHLTRRAPCPVLIVDGGASREDVPGLAVGRAASA